MGAGRGLPREEQRQQDDRPELRDRRGRDHELAEAAGDVPGVLEYGENHAQRRGDEYDRDKQRRLDEPSRLQPEAENDRDHERSAEAARGEPENAPSQALDVELKPGEEQEEGEPDRGEDCDREIRAREDLVGTRTALTNQLRAELERFWPGPLGLFTHLNSRISLAFLARYPIPADARGLGEARLQAFLARERYSGRQQPAQLLANLRRAPAGRVGELELATRRQLVLTLVATIITLGVQIKELERQLATAIREHPDGAIFTSLFKGPYSVITAAELLAEIGDCRARYPSRDALAGDAGQAAVAIESGKRKAACFRWGCNKRLRSAFCTLADSTRHWHPWAQDLYAAARARGHDHPARYAPSGVPGAGSYGECWQDGVPYDPARHRVLQRHITVTIPTPSGPWPDLAATQRMAGAAVTRRAARRAEREALDRKTPTAIQT